MLLFGAFNGTKGCAVLRKIYNWNPSFPFYYGWAILAASFFSTFAATSVAQVVLGGVQVFILEETGWKETEFSITIAIGTWLSGFISPFVGKFADKYGPRQMMPIALVIVAICYFIIGGIPAFVSFGISYIVARTITQPILINVVPRTVTVNFFRKRRNIALSLVTMSRPVAGAFNIHLISYITKHYGWRNAYHVLGAFSLILTIPLFFIMRKTPEEIGLEPDGSSENPKEGSAGQTGDTEYSWMFQSAIRTKAFWLLAIVTSLVTLSSSSVQFTLVPYYVETLSLSKIQAASIFSLGTVLALSNLLWALLADKYSPRKILICNLTIAALLLIALMNIETAWEAWVFAIFWGVFSGAAGTLEQMVLAQYFGRGSYGTITGAIGPMQITALGCGPAVGAIIHTFTGSYHLLYILITITYVSCACFTVLARQPGRPTKCSINQVQN